ncbi:hypothetical protein DERF_006119 [Dermatophagoides farinae]|uniref:Uncharacterized protein n=1 Tax=Dermatophagoides farinae TaxID=6954 RepID=A0A922I8D6_DERFA|nr:hypothetical protein DERF_006119 [Dermatophagoides farinae]
MLLRFFSFNNNDNHGSGQSVFILILILCVQMRSSRKITINDYMIPKSMSFLATEILKKIGSHDFIIHKDERKILRNHHYYNDNDNDMNHHGSFILIKNNI